MLKTFLNFHSLLLCQFFHLVCDFNFCQFMPDDDPRWVETVAISIHLGLPCPKRTGAHKTLSPSFEDLHRFGLVNWPASPRAGPQEWLFKFSEWSFRTIGPWKHVLYLQLDQVNRRHPWPALDICSVLLTLSLLFFRIGRMIEIHF